MAGGAICSGLAPAAGARLQAPRAAMPAAQPVAWRRAPSLPRATPGSGGGDPTQQMSQQISPTTAEDEARVEALAARSRKAAPRGARRPIPIRNMPSSRAEEPSSSGAEWREGKLLPEGWESMDLLQRATELYMGRRGALYWCVQQPVWACMGASGSRAMFATHNGISHTLHFACACNLACTNIHSLHARACGAGPTSWRGVVPWCSAAHGLRFDSSALHLAFTSWRET